MINEKQYFKNFYFKKISRKCIKSNNKTYLIFHQIEINSHNEININIKSEKHSFDILL
jgi:hypothetical protein